MVTVAMGRPVLLETAASALAVPRQQDQPELGRLRLGQVGQLAVGRARPGQTDRAARTRRAGGPAAGGRCRPPGCGPAGGGASPCRMRPGLDAQRVPLEAPAGDHPVDVAVDGRDQGDHDEVVGLGRAVLRLRVDGGDEGQQDEGRHEAADARHRRERVEAAPALSGRRWIGRSARHMPAAIDSPSSVSRSRSRAASAVSRPGIRASLAAAAVCSLTVDRWKSRSIGPAVTSTNCILP